MSMGTIFRGAASSLRLLVVCKQTSAVILGAPQSSAVETMANAELAEMA
jgi:hypothetical protein